MHLLQAAIQGYRSLKRIEIPLADLTACIGPNGSGKSSFLGALKLFFEPSSRVDELDFWSGTANETAERISIIVTFTELDHAERERFSGFLSGENGSLTFERRFEEPGQGVYLAQRLAVPQFSTIRMLQRSHRDEYNNLVLSNEFEGLELASSKDDAFQKMTAWEQANPDRCELRDEEVSILDDLLKSLTFVSVSAFEDPSAHVDAEGQGAVSRLLAKVVDQTRVQAQLQQIADDAVGQSDQILTEASDGFEEFAQLMEGMLDRFAPGCRLSVSWIKPEVKSSRPRLAVDVETSDGLARPLDYQGHGVQRALMYAALAAQAEGQEVEGETVLLLIEEPEAFQHPLSCRVLANTLRELSGRNYQIVYSTHSPSFIHPELVDGLRIFHRADPTGFGASTSVESLGGDSLLIEWVRIFEGEDYTIESVLARLKAHLPPQVLEGLFARACILVEGDEDEAIVRGAALREALDLDATGLAVIQTNGKTGMPNVLAFYGMAGISTYPIFDLDRGKNEGDQHREAEDQILRALGELGEATRGVHEQYACWEHDLTSQLEGDIGDPYQEMLHQAATTFGYLSSRGRKVPAVIAELLHLTDREGIESPTLTAISQRLREIAAIVS